MPSFDLPEAVPNSPGDVVLTIDNSVVTKTGAATETYCNGDSAEYYGEDGNWYNAVRPFPDFAIVAGERSGGMAKKSSVKRFPGVEC